MTEQEQDSWGAAGLSRPVSKVMKMMSSRCDGVNGSPCIDQHANTC